MQQIQGLTCSRKTELFIALNARMDRLEKDLKNKGLEDIHEMLQLSLADCKALRAMVATFITVSDTDPSARIR